MLKELQEWFGKAISSTHFETDAQGILSPSPTLSANDCLAIYHTQYWRRLMDVLAKTFPTVVRAVGDRFFEEIARPFLVQHPPQTWALCRIGEKLPHFLEGQLAILAALDWAAELAFWEEEKNPIDFSTWSDEEILTRPLTLQPYISLFALDADYFSYREGGELKERPGFFVVYRSPKKQAAWMELDKNSYELLSCFKKGCSIEAACGQISGDERIAFWFKDWTAWGFFSSYSLPQDLCTSHKKEDV